jgi:hypothetical protein
MLGWQKEFCSSQEVIMDQGIVEVELPDELEDLEVCCKEGRAARCVRRYRIRIDREHFVVNVTHMTGRQILELAGKCEVTKWQIFQKLHGELKKIGLDEVVDFTAPGVEKFKTLPLDQTEGSR